MNHRWQGISRLLGLGLILGLLLVPAAVAAVGATAPGTGTAGGGVQWLADADYFPAVLTAIDQARREIWLSAFFFKTNGQADHRPDQVLARLKSAAGRGVSVWVLFEQGPADDLVTQDNRNTAERLKPSGVRVCFDSPERTTHAKLMVVDGQFLFVGSHNLTQSALRYNHEVSVRIESPALAEAALRYLRSLCP